MFKRLIYTVWCTTWVITLFLGLYPALLLTVQRQAWLGYHQRLMRFWAEAFCTVAGISRNIRYNEKISANTSYVFCCNHFSSFDNLSIFLLLRQPFAIIGLTQTGKLPLLGYFFRKVHLTIDRGCKQSKKRAFWESLRRLKAGVSVVISPEGGIRSLTPPHLFPFEDGPFVLAIKSKRPVVPFTLHTNYRIVPEFPLRYIYRHPLVVEFHDPIPTADLTLSDVQRLKAETHRTIQAALYRSSEIRAEATC